MKILWLTGQMISIVQEELSGGAVSFGGGWLDGISDGLYRNDGIELAVCSPNDSIKELQKGTVGQIRYYLFPEKNRDIYDSSLACYFKQVSADFCPDVIHVFGTEYPRTLSMLKACSANKIIISITGLVSLYAPLYCGSVPNRYRGGFLRNATSSIVGFPSMDKAQKDYERRSKYETLALKAATHVIGRTTWDYSAVTQINPSVNYHFNNESLREVFYSGCWNYDNCHKHSIMVPQAGYPIKGFEQVLKAVCILREMFPDVCVTVSGGGFMYRPRGVKKFLAQHIGGYEQYLVEFIRKNNLEGNVRFTGPLSANDMKAEMLQANVFVLPSIIENSPNSLGEAMMLGVPCVSSYVGGIGDLFNNQIDGYLYPYNEPHLLAYYVSRLFNDREKAEKCGENAKKHAAITHNRAQNTAALIEIYQKVMTKVE